MIKKLPKIFVLDTNVLLHDHTSIYKFEEHDVHIPMIVLEELDKFKKGNDQINFQAREFIRELDRLSGDSLFTDGISLGEGQGRLFIQVGNFPDEKEEEFQFAFATNKPDNRILFITSVLSKKNPERDVVLISKDINLRMKAKSIGILASDYANDKIESIENLYQTPPIYEEFDPEIISRFYQEHELPGTEVLPGKEINHRYCIFRNGSQSVMTYYDIGKGTFEKVTKRNIFGIEPRNSEQVFALDALMRKDIQLVALSGKAGTGKTLLALASALYQRQEYTQIFLARPIVPLGNREIGFLPGDAREKVDPYMQPLFDNLNVIKHKLDPNKAEYKKIDEMQANGKLHIAPLAFIRGRSLDRIFFIIDEAQNLTPNETKAIVTRAGEGAKIVFTGDVYQIDTPYLDQKSNGLSHLIDRMQHQDLFAHVNLVKGERSRLAELGSNLL